MLHSVFQTRKIVMDEWAIRAELKRRGLSFKSLALESGMSVATIRAALVKPSTHANLFIAQRLGMSAHELWPDWFDEDNDLIPRKIRTKLSRRRRAMASHESVLS